MKQILFTIFFLMFCSFLFAEESFFSFHPSVTLTSELSGIIKNADIEPDEVLTSKDIKLLGVDNIPDLLKYISGVNVYRINNSSVEFSLRGIPGFYRIQPLILIDGMEIMPNIYDKVFFYTFPVTIDDIEKIEVIKDPAKFVNGIETPGGVINIVTRKPELLTSNYINGYFGTDKLVNTNVSINKFTNDTYLKVTGQFKRKDELHSSQKAISKKLISVSASKFYEHSTLFVKASMSELNFRYSDIYRALINNSRKSFDLNFKFKDSKLYNFFVNYDTSSDSISLYTQIFTGKMGHGVYNDFYSEYYKISFKKFINFKSFNFIPGIILAYQQNRIKSQGKGKRETFIGYLNSEYNLSEHIKLSLFIKNQRSRNLKNEFTYKTSITYSTKDFKAKLGYAKNLKNPSMLIQYYSLYQKIDFLNFKLTTYSHADKTLRPEKFYTTYFFLAKRFDKLSLKGEFFYNRLTDFYLNSATIQLFPPRMDMYIKNKVAFSIHGFSLEAGYRLNKYLRFESSYYIQRFKNKSTGLQGNYIMPEYKILSNIFFDFPAVSGNIRYSYTPRIFTECSGESDYLSVVDLTVKKSFFNKKFIASVTVQNLFNDTGKEVTYGEKLERSFLFKVKYNF